MSASNGLGITQWAVQGSLAPGDFIEYSVSGIRGGQPTFSPASILNVDGKVLEFNAAFGPDTLQVAEVLDSNGNVLAAREYIPDEPNPFCILNEFPVPFCTAFPFDCDFKTCFVVANPEGDNQCRWEWDFAALEVPVTFVDPEGEMIQGTRLVIREAPIGLPNLVTGAQMRGVNIPEMFIDFMTITPAEPKFLKGDVNGDGLVNLLDVAPFVDAIQSGNFVLEADVNCDGIVNLLDVAPFVDLLAG